MRLSEVIVRVSGRVMNALGVPGFVSPTNYKSQALGIRVQVRCSGFFTVVSVDGLDVYFTRLTGRVDGVGFSPTSDCRPASVPESGCFASPPDSQPQLSRTRKLSGSVE